MQLPTLPARLLLATAGLALANSAAKAALDYDDGDLLLAFRATGGAGANTNYLVNLGNAATYVNATQILTLDIELGNLKADLDALYTADWKTRVDFFWSVSGVQKVAGNGFTTNTMFATAAQTGTLTLGIQGSTAWTRPSAFGAGAPALKMQSFGERFELGDGDATPNGSTESSNSSFALIQPANSANSYSSFMPGGVNTQGASAFGYFSSATTIEGSFSAGTAGVMLDFYHIAPGSGNSAFEGTFTLNDNATVTFAPTGVPEPSSMMALALGVTVLSGIRRRSKANA